MVARINLNTLWFESDGEHVIVISLRFIMHAKDTTGLEPRNGNFVFTAAQTEDLKWAKGELQKYIYIMEQLPSTVVITDPQGCIEYVNPKFCHLTGYLREEVLGQNPRFLKSGDIRPEDYRAMWETIISGREWRGEFHNKTKNGESFWEYAWISCIRNDKNDIVYFFKVGEDITARKLVETARKLVEQERDRLITQMRELAVLDPLTQLYNRRGLEEALEQIWLTSRRQNRPVGIIIIDIDHFKTINDSYGHIVGDQVLCEFSRLIQKCVRTSDVVGRYGGDEFVVILPLFNEAETFAIAEQILQKIRYNIFCESSHCLRVTASLGMATNAGDFNLSADEILTRTDQSLYMAKRNGRNRLCMWSEHHKVQPPSSASIIPLPPEMRPGEGIQHGHILVVDDDPGIGLLIKRILEKAQYRVFVATNSQAALETMERTAMDFDAALVDLQLANESGLDLIEKIQTTDNSIICIVITGHATVDNAISSLRHGAFDFIEKPFAAEPLCITVDRAIKYRRLLVENQRYQTHLEDIVRQKSAALSRALNEIRQSYDFTLEALAALLDAREHATAQHSARVAKLARILSQEMGLSERDVDDISRGALLHDIGKMAIPDAILMKPGRLNEEEWKVVKNHPKIGYDILKSSPFLHHAAEIVYSHQEKYDGSGYPRGLRGLEICLGARIFAVVDAYDAMRTGRIYSKIVAVEQAIEEIKSKRGTQFDPDVVDALLRCLPQIEAVGQWEGLKPQTVEETIK
jgi:diguanylate cyclase (GGDEF)-like protein/PAS domain S-box-containing protein/putative nucleotidyltransferase with HDIG domain